MESPSQQQRGRSMSPEKKKESNKTHNASPRPQGSRSRSRSRSRSPLQRQRSPFQRVVVNRNRDISPQPSNVLGVFGLSFSSTEQGLNDLFGKYGQLTKVVIVTDSYTRASRGFAFVTFENVDGATDARKATNGIEFDGRAIRVDYSLTPAAHQSTPGQYMGKIHPRDARDRDSGRRRERSRSRRRSRSVSRRRYRSRSRDGERSSRKRESEKRSSRRDDSPPSRRERRRSRS